jgi:hypothetical protein
MKLRILLLLAIASSVTASDVGDNVKQRQARIAEEIETWPISKTQLFLYSLDPSGGHSYAVNTEQVFHGFTIMGKAEVATNDEAALLKSFAQGISESDGKEAMCFNPRHGLRVIIGPSTNDFTICFECLSVMAYGFDIGQEFPITTSPSAKFNDLVNKYHLKNSLNPIFL